MAFPLPHLLLLPIELLFELSDHLPLDSILALKLTHRVLNDNLPTLPRLRNRTLDRCSRFAIERLHISPNEAPAHQRCILCKIVYPQAMFTSSSSPACLPIRFEEGAPRTEVVQLPKGFCSWHVGRLARVIRTEPGGLNEWVSDVKRMCMHNGCVEGWHDCTCACSSCGYKMVRTYTRFLNNKLECKKFYFWRNTAAGTSEDPDEQAAGRLYVQEVCWNPSEFYRLCEGWDKVEGALGREAVVLRLTHC